MTEGMEKHYYGTDADPGREAMAQRAAELGYESYAHPHPYGAECVAACRKVRVAT